MKDDLKLTIGQISIQIASCIILGILSFGIYILEPKYTAFSYTAFGIGAILFYNYCRRTGLKNYILLGLLYSILINTIFQRTYNILRFGRNISWYIVIGILTYYLTIIEKKEWYINSKAWIVSSWLFGFILVYMIMSFANIFVFCFYHLDEHVSIWLYIRQSVKIGGTLGIGIGLGILISGFIFKEKLSV